MPPLGCKFTPDMPALLPRENLWFEAAVESRDLALDYCFCFNGPKLLNEALFGLESLVGVNLFL